MKPSRPLPQRMPLQQSLLRSGTSTASIPRQAVEISAPAPTPPASPLRRCSSMPTNSPWDTSTTPFPSFRSDLNRVYPPSGRGDQCTSADSAGFPIAPLLFNADELAVGHIDHAIRFILPNPRIRAHVYVHPATHAGAPRGPVDAPPIGARFRLKASYDVSKLMPEAQEIARAMQGYE